jgi:hypothetical protein
MLDVLGHSSVPAASDDKHWVHIFVTAGSLHEIGEAFDCQIDVFLPFVSV